MPSLRDAFEQLLALPCCEREQHVDAMGLTEEDSQTLRLMLQADAQLSGPLDVPVDAVIERLRDEVGETSRLIGTMLGQFRVVALLGEGGSSSVFKAERQAGAGVQVVALKVLRAGLLSASSERRFRRESAILAQLDHPGIARLIESGISPAGIPYIAMELVDGMPITKAVADLALSMGERLHLFTQLCRAVGAAHASLVIHRDIKPSNVLVDSRGEIKVVDFGIARLIQTDAEDAFTHTLAMTPEYAAPEQLQRGHQTVAVDVFALGVLLAELLTGQRLRGQSLSASLSSDNVPSPPGLPPREELRRRLRGDLDAIARKATSEEVAARYTSVEALLTDMERHLAGQPVLARRPSTWYRTRKFVGRHRLGTTIFSGLALLVLCSLALAVWQAGIARQEAMRANTVRDLIVAVFESARASLPRDQRPSPELLVTKAGEQLRNVGALDAETRAKLDLTLGEVWLSMSHYEAAELALSRARQHWLSGNDVQAAAPAQAALAEAWQRQGRNEAARAELETILGSVSREPSPLLKRILHTMAAAQMELGESEEALASMREAEEIAIAVYGINSLEALHMGFEVGGTLAVSYRHAEAIAVIEPLVERWRAQQGPEDDRLSVALNNLIVSHYETGRPDDAILRMREVLDLRRRIYTAPHEAIAASMRNLAGLLSSRGEYSEAIELLEEAVDMDRQVLGADHVRVAKSMDALGVALVNGGRFEAGEAMYSNVMAICKRTAIVDDVCPRSQANLGQSYYKRGLLDAAAAQLREALERRIAMFGPDHLTVAVSRSRLATVEAERGNGAEAVRMAQASVDLLTGAGRARSQEAVVARTALARGMMRTGDHARALQEVDRALEEWTPSHRVELRLSLLILRAGILVESNRLEEAAQMTQEARSAIHLVDSNVLLLEQLRDVETRFAERASVRNTK